MNYTEVEAKVREATNDDHWGPTGQQMNEVSQFTFSYESFPEVMGMLWKRMLQDNRTNWRRTYKSLILLHYLVRNGSERVVTSSREHIYDLRTLEKYTFIDESGKDMGINVRHRAKQLVDFIQDDDRLREERKKAKKNKDKYIGVAADSMGGFGSYRGSSGTGGGGGSGGGYSDEWNNSDKKSDEDDEPTTGKKFEDEEPPVSPAVSRSPVPAAPAVSKPAVSKAPAVTSAPKAKAGVKLDPSKKIDLGAAASYTGSSANPVTQVPAAAAATPAVPTSDLLADLFDTGVNISAVPAPVSAVVPALADDDEFADFTAFRSSANAPAVSPALVTSIGSRDTSDEFADFSSAFTAGTQQQQPVNLLDSSFSSIPSDVTFTTAGNQYSSLPLSLTPLPDHGLDAPTPPSLDPLTGGGVTAQQLFSSTLQPTRPATLLPHESLHSNHQQQPDNKSLTSSSNSNNTWSGIGLNIDVDNLLSGNNDKQVKPSMNQLAATTASTPGLMSPSSPFGSSARVAPALTPGHQAKAGFISNNSPPPNMRSQW